MEEHFMKQEVYDLLSEIIEKVKFIFPVNREITPYPNQEIQADSACYKIDWPISDEERPNKRSKRIWLVISREFFDDYQGLTEVQKQEVINGACGWIEMKYKHFDASNLKHQDSAKPPREIWHIPFNR